MIQMKHSTSLDDWLDVATRGLRVQSRERIRDEVSEHFDAAFADAVESGVDERAAVCAALASLGNPRSARRRFRHEHFTAHEAFAYLGEDTVVHRNAEMRTKAFFMMSAFLTTMLCLRILEYESTTQWWNQVTRSLVGSSLGLALGSPIVWQVGRVQGWPKARAQTPAKSVSVARSTGVGFLIVGLMVFVPTAFALLGVYIQSVARGPFEALATGPRLLVATIASLYFMGAGAFSLYGYARLKRLFAIELGPKARG